MKEFIDTAEQLCNVCSCGGLHISTIEAEIILCYMGGHGYKLLRSETNGIWRLDINEEGTEPEPYPIDNAVEFCIEQNTSLIEEAENTDDCDVRAYLTGLKKDQQILDDVANRLWSLNKPLKSPDGSLIEYSVRITETLSRVVKVKAKSAAEAEDIAGDRWRNSEWILCADDFDEVEFRAM